MNPLKLVLDESLVDGRISMIAGGTHERGVISVAMLERQDDLSPSDLAVLKSVNPLGYKRYLKRQEKRKEKEMRFARLKRLRDEILERQEEIVRVDSQIEQIGSINSALSTEHDEIVGKRNARISSILDWTEEFDDTYNRLQREGAAECKAKQREAERAREEGEKKLAVLRSIHDQKTAQLAQLTADLSALLSFHPSSSLSDAQRSTELRKLADEIVEKRKLFADELREKEKEVMEAKERIERSEGDRLEIVAEKTFSPYLTSHVHPLTSRNAQLRAALAQREAHNGQLVAEVERLRSSAMELAQTLAAGYDERRDLIGLARKFRCDPEDVGVGSVKEALTERATLNRDVAKIVT
ncbi:hypothetical protein HDU93_007487 [Gonapodya sp. JEL0774]|nr:hypothetical protein HDU93_007487 [Gonapodya sp. JEL0774]